MPPPFLLEAYPPLYVAAPEVVHWQREVLINPDSPLTNPEHAHLMLAQIGVLWTNVSLVIRGSRKAAVAMMPQGRGSVIDRTMHEFWMTAFFRVRPDFLIVIDATVAAQYSDRQWCRLNDHELTHCGQLHDAEGMPVFHQEGSDKEYMPKFSMKPHDHEFFRSEVRRWGARTTLGDDTVNTIMRAELEGPEFTDEEIRARCGTCALKR